MCDLLDRRAHGAAAYHSVVREIDAAGATAVIRTWRLKFDVGFWRPFEAVAGAGDDGNPATDPETGWVSLVLTPAYSDYTSGHASATAPFATVLRSTLGDDVSLHLVNPVWDGARLHQPHAAGARRVERSDLGGLHFRDAMDDGYHLGHVTARRVMRALR